MESALDELARKYVWWGTEGPPSELFLCQLMQLGTYEDVRRVRSLLGDDAFRAALREAPPGILDARSWSFWHLILGIHPIPPMPERPLPWTPLNRS